MLDKIESLILDDPDFDELDRLSDVYCPFEAIGMVRQEIRHGYFLAHCLDPTRPHGFGAEPLKAFIRLAATSHREDGGSKRQLRPIDAHLLPLDEVTVLREWWPYRSHSRSAEKVGQRGSRLDLLLVMPAAKLVTAVELKIDASEHGNQLRRYREEVRHTWPEIAGWRHLFIFLTKDGEPASDSDGEGWSAVSLGDLTTAFDGLLSRGIGVEPAREMLTAYGRMLRRHVVTDERAEELAVKLWERHREALAFLMERQPGSSATVLDQLFERRQELARLMASAADSCITLDDSARGNIRFAVTAWDDLPDFCTSVGWTGSRRMLLLELAPDSGRNAIRARFVVGPGEASVRRRLLDALLSSMPKLTQRREFTGTWTRLGTETLVRGLGDEDADVDALTDKVVKGVVDYAREMVPRFDAALANLRG